MKNLIKMKWTSYLLLLFVGTANAELERPTNTIIQHQKKIVKPIPKLPTTLVKLKEFVVPGNLAWAAAKDNGFEFYPEGARGRKDGIDVWGASYYNNQQNRLQTVPNTARYSAGINMQLGTLINSEFWDLTEVGVINSYARFHLFAGKRLKSRWSVRNIEVSGSHAVNRRPAANSRSAHYVLDVEIKKGARNTGLVTFKKIVLIGPENQDWREAFKN
ncbi:hypothetical protein [Paraglaciecola arctica]|uniref:Uncharacterized protein n=1 Tax=Paraglaciecola arctica BSs20135 TaxID=493475 RepID=K6Z469_9ALTE|nr:hypothetical protein [Paraglaciecola arctica]GAC18230.1 hypothetical protein GARC_1250 [Paraglaciecola arctica BSs20135]